MKKFIKIQKNVHNWLKCFDNVLQISKKFNHFWVIYRICSMGLLKKQERKWRLLLKQQLFVDKLEGVKKNRQCVVAVQFGRSSVKRRRENRTRLIETYIIIEHTDIELARNPPQSNRQNRTL